MRKRNIGIIETTLSEREYIKKLVTTKELTPHYFSEIPKKEITLEDKTLLVISQTTDLQHINLEKLKTYLMKPNSALLILVWDIEKFKENQLNVYRELQAHIYIEKYGDKVVYIGAQGQSEYSIGST